MKEQELFEKISKKLSALLALLLTPEPEKQTTAKKVELLVRFGFDNREIADVLGTTKGTVEVLKSRISKKQKSYAKQEKSSK